WTTTWTDFFLKIVVTSQDETKTESVIVNVKTADAYAPLEMKDSVPASAAKVDGTTIKLASNGTDLTVAELIALFKTAPEVVVKNAYGVEIDASELTVDVASSSPYTMTITFDGQPYTVALSQTLA
ncbi:MAG: hypothetical protein PUE96_04800, partial [Oscillospiraceae bacterium]|nr:hypothetical protein [Oscillospiraceae bacterium]